MIKTPFNTANRFYVLVVEKDSTFIITYVPGVTVVILVSRLLYAARSTAFYPLA